MTTSAIVMMVLGILIIWGGLTASIIHAVKSAKR
ncbi:methionine/alanine import family NSS transporter small subunit [Amphibacillus sediminis]|nr:methionine/alanine import family NSS transporter small subunit [Amphibacillus sediminis]